MKDEHELLRGLRARLRMRRLAPGSIDTYANHLRDFLAWCGDRDPASLSTADLETHLEEWHARLEDELGSPPSASSVRVRVAALRALYLYLESKGAFTDERGRTYQHPAVRLTVPRRERKAIDYLSEEEDAALQDCYATPQERILIHLLRFTGLRISEATALEVRDVDLSRGEIRVRRSKSDAGVRTLPIAPQLRPELERHLRLLSERADFGPALPVLATRRGTPMFPQFAWRIIQRTARRAGVRDGRISPHTFRRTFATDLRRRGVPMDVISRLLGHANTGVTEAAYAEVMSETVREEFLGAMESAAR
jgi:integrase/recombinase XerD